MKLLHRNKLLLIAVIILLSLFSIAPLFHKGFFVSDDGEWMIIRFSSFYQTLRDGQFPVRFLSRLNNEYGYPVANFLYPGFLYMGVLFRLLHIGFVDTVKILLGVSMVSSALFMFFFLSRLFPSLAAAAAALIYIYSPYHLFDITKRGSVGEVLALAVAPFIFWQIEKKSFFWTSTGIAMLILAHNTVALLFLPIIVFYMFLRATESKDLRRQIYRYTCMLALGFLLSAFFWIPAVYDLQFTKFTSVQVSEWASYFVDAKLIGFSTIVIFLVTLSTFISDRTIFKFPIAVLFSFVFLISLVFTIPFSAPLWHVLPVSFIQFPFRFLSLTIFSAAFLAGLFLSKFSEKSALVLAVFLMSLAFFSSWPYLFPSGYIDKGEGFYTTNMDTTTVKNEYMPKWVQIVPTERPDKKIEFKDGLLQDVRASSNRITATVASIEKSAVTVNTVYFPGWVAKVDGKKVPILYHNKKGLIRVSVPAGTHMLDVSFTETAPRLFSDFLSLAGLLILFVIAIKNRPFVNFF